MAHGEWTPFIEWNVNGEIWLPFLNNKLGDDGWTSFFIDERKHS
jgi:hypothetical protein